MLGSAGILVLWHGWNGQLPTAGLQPEPEPPRQGEEHRLPSPPDGRGRNGGKTLAEDINTDTTGAEDESMSGENNALIKSLRKQIEDLKKESRNAPTREDIEAEIRADLTREAAIADLLVGLGHPKGMSAVVKGKMGDAEVTVEAVAEALQSLGYAVQSADGERSEEHTS